MGMRIPHDKLSEDVLYGVIESYVLREGTDYGEHEVAMSTKIEQVRRQLDNGKACILFDPETESISIVCPRDVPPEA